MVWEQLQLEDQFKRNGIPFISISLTRISFSASFSRLVDIDKQYRTSIAIDSESLKVSFEFHREHRLNSLALTPDHKTSGKKSGLFCSAHSLNNKYNWIARVAALNPIERRFYPKKEGRGWVIELCPTFDRTAVKGQGTIPKELSGIYRYIGKNGEIVYIGRGNIYRRLKSVERVEWEFSIVEYSVVPDVDIQVLWENYFINQFVASNGCLPLYNRNHGTQQPSFSKS